MKRAPAWWRIFWAQDWMAILLAAGLLAAGLTFIYSASWRGEETGIVGAWFSKQIWWAALGAAVIFCYHPRQLFRHRYPACGRARTRSEKRGR